MRISNAEIAESDSATKRRLSAVYDQPAPLLSKRGQQIVNRAMRKDTVGVDVGMQLLFKPAMLLSLVGDTDVLYKLAPRGKHTVRYVCGR